MRARLLAAAAAAAFVVGPMTVTSASAAPLADGVTVTGTPASQAIVLRPAGVNDWSEICKYLPWLPGCSS